jgi:adenylylsulfate reductase subunit B
MPPVIDEELCIQCGECAEACQSDVFFGAESGKTPQVTYPEECWHCNACVLACPVGKAVTLRIPLPMMVLYQERAR